MKFGLFYEIQLPFPHDDDEACMPPGFMHPAQRT